MAKGEIGWHAARTGRSEMLLGYLEGKKPLFGSRYRWKDNMSMKTDLKEMGLERAVGLSDMFESWGPWLVLVNAVMNLLILPSRVTVSF
jgi:hypothetical protein